MLRRRRGAAMVELALTMPVLVLMLMGVIEFGMIMHDKLMLDNAVSQGARAAAMGQTVKQVQDQVVQAAPGLKISPELVQVVGNDAPSGSMVQVKIQGYPHHLVTGSFFSWLPGCQGGSLPLSASLAMTRQ